MAGKRFHFAADARVVEWAPERRLTWAYVKKRKFLSGQIRVFVQAMARPGALWRGGALDGGRPGPERGVRRGDPGA